MKKKSNLSESGSVPRKSLTVITDHYADVDHIGYSAYSRALVEMIRSIKTPGAFTFGVYGHWGQGKTSMLRQIKKILDDTSEPGLDPVLTVWFNPWQFTGEDHLIIPFFHLLIQSLKDHEKHPAFSAIKQKITGFLKEIAGIPVALAYGMAGKLTIPGIVELSISGEKVLNDSRRQSEQIRTPEPSDELKLLQQYQSLYYSLVETLRNAAEALGTKIVVFIDDLDRCLPEKAVELLEGLKVLLDINGFIFVIGVAPEIIERGIKVRYKSLFAADPDPLLLEQNYLDKIVQFPMTLPPAEPALLRQYIREELLRDLPDAAPFLDTILAALGNNPRTIKRFINEISFSIRVADLKRKDNPSSEPFLPELIIKMALIVYQFRPLYRLICRSPYHLIRIQEAVQAMSKTESDETKPSEPVNTEFGFLELDRLKLRTEPKWSSISAILKRGNRTQPGTEPIQDRGFRNKDEVERYACMLAVSLSPDAPDPQSVRYPDSPLAGIIQSRMIRIGGEFQRGDKEQGQHPVTVSDFEMDKYPVTQDLYQQVMGDNPSHFQGDDKPVETVTWFDCIAFCNRLSLLLGFKPCYFTDPAFKDVFDGKQIKDEISIYWDRTANGFRLPTEAEWEFACRAGTVEDQYDDLDKIAWYEGNSDQMTHGVGQKNPNSFGLFDMLGNVWEWCWDWYGDYPTEHIADPAGPSEGSHRVVRGGSWSDIAGRCRSACRDWYGPGLRDVNLGFRFSRGHLDTPQDSSPGTTKERW